MQVLSIAKMSDSVVDNENDKHGGRLGIGKVPLCVGEQSSKTDRC